MTEARVTKALPLDGGDEQVAMSPGHGCAVRSTAHLLMGGGERLHARRRSRLFTPPLPLPIKGRER
jgi:hypothetical protein